MRRTDERRIAARTDAIGRGRTVGIAVAEFNKAITEGLLRGALAELSQSGVREEAVTTVRVPGSFELPLACARLAESGKFDALVALGAVIKGETDHYHHVAREASRGIMDVMLRFSIPIGFGVLTTHTLEQAEERSEEDNNTGAAAARAALIMCLQFSRAK